MSYIVPMKKPICINCPFRSLDSCTLIYLMSDKDSEVTVHVNEMTVSPDCPLVEVEPHGRLIDATFEENHYASMLLDPTPDVTEQDKKNATIIIEALRMARTVIEPEGSETE